MYACPALQHPPGPPDYNCSAAAAYGAFDSIDLQNGPLRATFIRYGATLTHLIVPDSTGADRVSVPCPVSLCPYVRVRMSVCANVYECICMCGCVSVSSSRSVVIKKAWLQGHAC